MSEHQKDKNDRHLEKLKPLGFEIRSVPHQPQSLRIRIPFEVYKALRLQKKELVILVEITRNPSREGERR